jgi:hypothetical protein
MEYLRFVLDPYITEVSFFRSVMELPLMCNGASLSFMRGLS